MQSLAPLIFGILFVIVAVALVRNFFDGARRDPDEKQFDAVDAFIQTTGGKPGGRVRYNPQ